MLDSDGEAVTFVGQMAAAGRPQCSDRLFSETRTNAGSPSDQPNPTNRCRRPWSDAPRSGVRSAVACRRLHPHIMHRALLSPSSKLHLTDPTTPTKAQLFEACAKPYEQLIPIVAYLQPRKRSRR
jgi:hypothetical protein